MPTAADMTVKIGGDASGADAAFAHVDQKVKGSAAGMGTASGLFAAGAGLIAGGFAFAANSAMNFDGAMADVSASLGTTDRELEGLRQQALQIGQDTIFSATEGAQAIEELGRAGMAIPDIMNGGALATANLAAATGESLPASANVMANAMNIFQLSGDQAAATADTMTAALNESSLTLTDFSQGMASAGTMAASVGMSFEQTSAALALFSSYGLSGADAGTALRSMLTSLANPTADAAAEMDKYGISLQEGIESGDLMGYIAGKLETGLAGLSESERMAALNTMFGADAQRIANILYEAGAEGVAEMTDKMRANGQAQEAARRRMAGLRGAVESLKGSIETAAIIIGAGLTPYLQTLAEWLGDLVNGFSSLPEPMVRLISIAAAVAGGLMALAAAIGGVMAAGALIPGGFGAVGAAMMAILGPVALIVAALAGLYIAWRTNFLGIQDAVLPVVAAVTDALGSLFDIFAGTITGDLDRLQEGFENLADPLKQVGVFVFEVASAFKSLYNAWAAGGLGGLIDAMPAQLARVGSAFLALGGYILDSLQNIDWGSLGSSLLGSLQSMVSAAFDGLGAAWDWVLNVAVPTLGGWYDNAKSWLTERLSDIAGVAAKFYGWILTVAVPKLAGWYLTAASWLGEKLGQIAGVAAKFFGWVLTVAVPTLGGWFLTAAGWLSEKLGQIAGVAAKFFGWVLTVAVPTLGGWFLSAAGWLSEKLSFSSIPGKVYGWTLTVAVPTLGGWATGAGSWLVNTIADKASGADWAAVGDTVARKAVASIGDAFSAGKALGGLANAIPSLVNSISKKIRDTNWDKAGEAVGRALVKGVAAFFLLPVMGGAFISGITAGLVGANWGAITQAVIMLLGNALRGMNEFIGGLFRGVWEGITDGLSDMAGAVEAAFFPVVNAVIDGINKIIAAWNMLPGVTKIDPINHMLTDAQKRADALKVSLDAVAVSAAGLSGLKQSTLGKGPQTTDFMKSLRDWLASGEYEALNDPMDPADQLPPPISPTDPTAPTFMQNAGLLDQYTAAMDRARAATGMLGSASTMAFGGVKTAFDTSIPPVSAGMTAASATITQGFTAGLTGMAPAATAALGGVKGAFQTQLGGVPPIVTGTLGAARGSAIAETSGMSAGVVGQLSTMSAGSLKAVSGMSSGISAHTSAARAAGLKNMSSLNSEASAQVTTLVSSVNASMLKMQSQSSTATATMNSNVIKQISQMRTGVTSATSSMIATVANNLSTMVSVGSSLMNSFANVLGSAARNGANQVRSALAAVPGIVASMGGAAAGAARAVGANIGNAMAAGMRSALGAIQAAAGAMVAAASVALMAKAMISSPSKLFMSHGYDTGLGYALGIDSTQPIVERATAGLVGRTIDAMGGVQTDAYLATQTGQLPPLATVQGPAPSYVYYDNRRYTVQVDDLPELQKAADFFNELQRDHELVTGAK